MSSKQRRLVGKVANAKNLKEFNKLKKQLDDRGYHPRWVQVGYSEMGTPIPLDRVRAELDNLNTIPNESPFISQVFVLKNLLQRAEVAASALEELPRARRSVSYRVEVAYVYKAYADQVTAYVRESREFGLAVLGVLDPTLSPERVEQLVNEFRGEMS